MANPLLKDAPVLLEATKFHVRGIDVATHDGGTRRREVIVHPGAVIILPLLDGDQVAMIRNERFAVGETLWELPAGTLEPPEPAIECAKRELEEEAGYRAGRIEPMTDFYTCPGMCTEHMFGFVATDLEHVGQRLEPTEKIEVEVMPFARTIEMIRAGDIRDAKTIVMLMMHAQFGAGSGNG